MKKPNTTHTTAATLVYHNWEVYDLIRFIAEKSSLIGDGKSRYRSVYVNEPGDLIIDVTTLLATPPVDEDTLDPDEDIETIGELKLISLLDLLFGNTWRSAMFVVYDEVTDRAIYERKGKSSQA